MEALIELFLLTQK